jgi:large subunit ribosomal protein L6
MSRIGNLPVPLADNVEFSIGADNVVTVKGEKGTGSVRIHPDINVKPMMVKWLFQGQVIRKSINHLHGLYRSLVFNMVEGVTQRDIKNSLKLLEWVTEPHYTNGVLELNLGFSHPIYFVPPEGIEIEVDTKSRKNPVLTFPEPTKNWLDR